MAGQILNRRELRKQTDQAEQAGAATPDAAAPEAKKSAQGKAAGAPRVRKPRAKKAPPRMYVRWGVFDGGARQVAIFDYNQRSAADGKLAEMLARNKGIYYLQAVKEPMPESVPAEVSAAD
jgi:hypothetical protein